MTRLRWRASSGVGDVDDGLRGIAWDRDGGPVGNGRGEALLVELDPVVEGVEWYVDGAGQVLARAVDEPEDEAAEDGGVGAVAALAPLDAEYPHAMKSVREDNFGMALWSRRPFADWGTRFFGEACLPTIDVLIEIALQRLR